MIKTLNMFVRPLMCLVLFGISSTQLLANDSSIPPNALIVDTTGNVGINTTSPAAPLHLSTGGIPFSPAFLPEVTTAIFQRDANAEDSNLVYIVSGNSNAFGVLAFGDSDLQMAGGMAYMHSANDADQMSLIVNGAWQMRLNNNSAGNLLEMSNNAGLTQGGVWTDASSRELKENIKTLNTDDALAALASLNPVTFNYKQEPNEDYVGFIAEEVPELVATASRKTLAPMDIVAVLAKVMQQQQQLLSEQKHTIATLQSDIAALKRLMVDVR